MANVPLHVVHRGNNKTQCFVDPADRRLYLGLLAQHSRRAGCDIHAYVLMSNHVHLLLTPRTDEAVSAMMKSVAQCYSQHFNRTWSRTGTLWEGRFHSCVVDTERYFLACQRYVEQNPVRAGICRSPTDYEWSSCRANASGAIDPIVTPHTVYLQLAPDPVQRRDAYGQLLALLLPQPDLDAIRKATTGGFVLGGPSFVSRLRGRFGRRVAPEPAGRRSRADGDDEKELLRLEENRGLSPVFRMEEIEVCPRFNRPAAGPDRPPS